MSKSVLLLLHPINFFPLVLPWLVLSSSGSLAKYQLDMTLAALLQTLTSLLKAPRCPQTTEGRVIFPPTLPSNRCSLSLSFLKI